MSRERQRHAPVGFGESETRGFFRVTKRDAALAIAKQLTASQLRLWLYLMMIDPFADQNGSGDRIYHRIPTPAEMAEKIGSCVDTVEKDLRKLRKLGLYEYKVTELRGYNCSAERAEAESQRMKQGRTSSKSSPHKDLAYLSPDSAYLSPDSAYLTPQDAYLSPDSAYLSPDGEPEPLPQKDFNSPQTYPDYSNFIQTLSEGERESFLEFGRKKAANLPHPPQLPDKWIAANFTELHKHFLSSSAGRAAKQEAIARKYDWENDPRLLDWLHKAYYVGHPWTQEDEAEREERFAFLTWAQTTNAYAGRIADEPA